MSSTPAVPGQRRHRELLRRHEERDALPAGLFHPGQGRFAIAYYTEIYSRRGLYTTLGYRTYCHM